MRLNYFSPVRLTLALLPELIERSGRIVNISSVAARLGAPAGGAVTGGGGGAGGSGLGPGAAAACGWSKAALTGWSESMQVDLAVAGTDVLVHVVNPGVI